MMDYEEKAREVLNAFEEELSFAHTVGRRAAVREKHRDRLSQAIREAVEGEWQRGYASGFRNGVDATPQSPAESPKSKPEGSK